jgi:dTMP kinase
MARFETYGNGIPGIDVDNLNGWLIVIEGTDAAGRTTQVDRLRLHLERDGYAVAETGLTRSGLTSVGLKRAKQGITLGTDAYTLFYATDFADRLEHQIIPALRAGFVMLTDRYIYSLIARAIVRGAASEWIKQVYSFALRPDAVFYLRVEPKQLIPRVLSRGGFDYWESGMDLPMGEDLYESFMNYQQKTIEQLDVLATEYGFDTIDGTAAIEDISDYLCQRVSAILRSDAHGREARAAAARSHSP